ncbi:hypothetical protein ACLRDC_11640 [Gluconacetobacter sacchari]|uniref:Flagellar biosynthetic protein FliO n=2 Tax=Gluconacetobacter sacchari TaxID=92759 RepID=A0A7W4I992_9PROT|nr:hypothetical protein [Gluconacetobacter sacchari]MBB2158618.1 hypothetical protein [Gluconacetobacter sacchari]GBQ24664.1 hypothetical protein AA12717_1854 [Gluconacetobacter sacchari DSM 12717]
MSGTGLLSASQTGSLAQGGGSFAATWLAYLASFAIVIVLILLSRHGLKFLEPYLLKGRRTRNLAIVESLAIDQRRRLSIIRYHARTGLILTGGGNDLFLGWVDEEQDQDRHRGRAEQEGTTH